MGLELLFCGVFALIEGAFGLLNEPVSMQLVDDLEGLHHLDGADLAALQFFGEIVADECHALIELLTFLCLLEDDGIELLVSFAEDASPPSLDGPSLAGDVSLHHLHVALIIALVVIFNTRLLLLLVVVD